MQRPQAIVKNRLIDSLSAEDRALLAPGIQQVDLERGTVLFEPGDDIIDVYLPGPGTIASLVINLRDGLSAEGAMIGTEGAAGGVISEGNKPAFTRGIIQVGGPALRISTDILESAKQRSPSLRDHFARYADCLLAQVLQSVACNAVHDFDARLARWLLTVQDRTGGNALHLTQDFMAEMLGVHRTYATRVVGMLEKDGAIRRSRGVVLVADRQKLEHRACECYSYLRRHFERLLPGVYPDFAG